MAQSKYGWGAAFRSVGGELADGLKQSALEAMSSGKRFGRDAYRSGTQPTREIINQKRWR